MGGNSSVIINHPRSLVSAVPNLESSKIAKSIPGMLKMQKIEYPAVGSSGMPRMLKTSGPAVGSSGRIIFKKNVLESQYTYRIIKEVSASFEVGREITVKAATEPEASAQVAVMMGISVTEVSECVILIKTSITDENVYSELNCYVDYEGKNNGRYEWTKNDLNLKATHRWTEDSEMIIDVDF